MLALLLAAVLAQPAPETPAPGLPPPPAGAEEAPAREVRPPRPPRKAAPPPGIPTPPAPPAAKAGPLQGDWPAAPSGKRVSVEDTISLDDALEHIADAAGWNLVLNTGRTGNSLLVLRLRNVGVEDALRDALTGTGLAATRRGDTVVVAPSERAVERRPTLSGFDKPSGKKFTGEFQETEADDALRQIAAAAGLSIVIPPGAETEVSGVFNATPVEDVLRAVLEQAGLTAERQGELITVRRAPGGLAGFPELRGLSDQARRAAERAMRDADREIRRAEREDGVRVRVEGGDDNDRVAQGDITIRPGERVHDVVAIRGNVVLESGAQANDVVAVLGSVTLEGGSQANNVTAVLGDVEVGPGAQIEENATAVMGHVKPDPAAMIYGEQTSVGGPELGLGSIFGSSLLFGRAESPLWVVGQVLAKFLLYFALGLLMLALFPRRVEGVATSMVANPWKSIFTGLLGLVAAPLLFLLLIVTIIGIPLVAVAVLLILAAGVLGFTALAYYIGRALPVQVQRNAWVLQLAIGTAIVVLVTQIPLIGLLAWVAAALLTFGATLRSRFGQHGPPVLPTAAVAPPPPATAP